MKMTSKSDMNNNIIKNILTEKTTGQRGIALVTVLMTTALVAILAVGMTSAQHIDIRRTGNLLESDQATLLAYGLEEWAIEVLLRDRQESTNDHLGEDWAMGLLPTTLESGMVAGSIADLHGRININNLVAANQLFATQCEISLKRLFSFCDIPEDRVQAVADWLDPDDAIRPYGAEDDEYLGKTPSYRAANRDMTSPTELMLIDGIDPAKYDCLARHVSTLPNASAININTASAMVIASLSEDISLAAAEEVVKDRPEKGYESVADFTNHPALAGSGISPNNLILVSNFFLVQGQATFGNAEINLFSVLQRLPETVEVVSRSIGTF